MTPFAVDFFSDQDLQAVANCRRIQDFFHPSETLKAIEGFPDAPWIYTGPLENQPAVVASIAEHRKLLGNPPRSLIAVRNPKIVQKAFQSSGLLVPEVQMETPEGLPEDGSWLRKPIASIISRRTSS